MTEVPANPRADLAPEAPVQRAGSPFRAGALVIVSLSAPREKFWGALLALDPAGVSVRGINLESFNDFAAQLRADEHPDAACVFLPMHRVERIELDSRSGDAPSVAERFQTKTGRDASAIFFGEVSA